MSSDIPSEFVDDYNSSAAVRVTPLNDDFSIFAPPRIAPQYQQGREKFTTRIVKNFLKSYDVFVDVGANIGYYSVLAGVTNTAIKIIAIEPIKENFELLVRNLHENQIDATRFQGYNGAVSRQRQKLKIFQSVAADNCSIYRHPAAGSLGQLQVDAYSLDEILKLEIHRRILVKIDTDGNELDVLTGLQNTIEQCHDLGIVLEINPKMIKIAGMDPMTIPNFLFAHGFKLFALDDDHARIIPLSRDANIRAMYRHAQNSFFNVLCLKETDVRSVAFFSHSGELGGAERSLLELIRGLSEQRILCTAILPMPGALENELGKNGCAVYCDWRNCDITYWRWVTEMGEYYSKRAILNGLDIVINQIVPVLKEIAPEIIFSQSIVSPWGAVCANCLGIPHVLSAREYGQLDHHLEFIFGFKECMQAFYNSSTAICCITQDVRQVLFGNDEEHKTTVIYSAPSLTGTVPAGSHLPSMNWHDGITVGLVGTYGEGKGHEDLIRAVLQIAATGRNIKCVMFGCIYRDEYFQRLKQLVNSSPWSDNFAFHSYVSCIEQIYQSLDIVVSCARHEALGRTLIEGILQNKPIIYANAGGPKEVFIDGEHGLAYTPGDASQLANCIMVTVDDLSATEQRMIAAKKYVKQKFTRENYVGSVMTIFRELKGAVSNLPFLPAVINLIHAAELNDLVTDFLVPTVYYGEANLFPEKQAIMLKKIPWGEFELEFELPSPGFTHLKLVPTRCYGMMLNFYRVVCQTEAGTELDDSSLIFYSNGDAIGSMQWQFNDFDSQVIFKLTQKVKKVKIWGRTSRCDKSAPTLVDTNIATIFYDSGKGFNKNDCLTHNIDINQQHYTLNFTIGAPVLALRFDPLEAVNCCLIENLKIIANGNPLTITSSNGQRNRQQDIFQNDDPQYFIEYQSEQETKLKISFDLFTEKAMMFNMKNALPLGRPLPEARITMIFYFRESFQSYSEERKLEECINGNQTLKKIYFPVPEKLESCRILRLDPADHKCCLFLSELKIYGSGQKLLWTLKEHASWAKLKTQGVKMLTEQNLPGLLLCCQNDDPQIVFPIFKESIKNIELSIILLDS